MVDKTDTVHRPKRLAVKASDLFCKYPDADDLPPQDKARFHAFKHDVIAGVYRLYTEIEPDTVDLLLRQFFATLIDDEIDRDETV